MRYFFLFFLLISCSISQQKENAIKQSNEGSEVFIDDTYYDPLTPSDIFDLIDFVIDISLEPFGNSEYAIDPVFIDNLSYDQLKTSLNESICDLTYSDQEVKQIFMDYELLKGDSIKKFLVDEEKIQRVNNQTNRVLILLSPPMVDRKNSYVFFKVNAYFPYEEGIGSDEVVYSFKLKDEKMWVLFCTIETKH